MEAVGTHPAPPPVAEGLEQGAVFQRPQLGPGSYMLEEGRETDTGHELEELASSP